MDIRLQKMGVDPHQYRNAMHETNERNRVYKQKFCHVWYAVCLVSLLVFGVLIIIVVTTIRIHWALVMLFVHLPIFICIGFCGYAKCAGNRYRAALVREVWDPVTQSHGVGVEMWSDQKHTGPVIGFGVTHEASAVAIRQ